MNQQPPPRAGGIDPRRHRPASCRRPERHDDLEGRTRRQQGNGRLHLLNRTYEGQAASTLALSCSNSAWVMAPLSRRPLADAISSAALLEDPAATDLT